MHTIRLTSQWDLEPAPTGEAASANEAATAEPSGNVPPDKTARRRFANVAECSRVAADGLGRQRLIRHFGLPTGLATGQRVQLVVDTVPLMEDSTAHRPADHGPDQNGTIEVALNDTILRPANDAERPQGQTTQRRYDVADWLQPRNRLSIRLVVAGQAIETIQDVRLEIS